MTFPFQTDISIPGQFESQPFTIKFYGGITTLLGPNGSGKSQVLRQLKDILRGITPNPHRRVRLLTAGRLSQIENYRSNYDGMRGIAYEEASFGGSNLRQYRHESESAIGDFHTLSIRPDIQIKISERLSTLFKRNIMIDWDAGQLKVKFSSLEGQAYSAAREASGLLQLVAILAALYDNEVGILLLDEPEISLHPQLQAFLFQEIKRIAGNPLDSSKKMIVMATHSTEFLDVLLPEDLSNIVFFENTSKQPVQIDPELGELKNRKVRELLTRLGQAHKAAFFSSKPLLVEGPSDVLICNALNHHLKIFLEAGGSQIIPVIGKGEIPTVVKLMRLIGKEPVVLTDLDTLADDIGFVDAFAQNQNIIEKLQKMGHGNLQTFSRSIYTDLTSLISNYWDILSPLAEHHSYWRNRDTSKEESIAKKRASIATLFMTPDEELKILQNGNNFLGIKHRLISLFDTLELAGCFILRKGTIENYYSSSSEVVTNKPNAAVEEIEHLLGQAKEYSLTMYDDIVRSLKYAASTKEIDESKAIANYLLAVASPALGIIEEEISDAQLQANAMKIVGEISSIFKLSKIINEGIPTLRVELNSYILEVSGFPVDFPKGANPIEIVRNKLR